MTYFLNSHFALLYLHHKLSVIILKVHYENTLKKNPSIFFNVILTKVYYNMDNKFLIMLMLNMTLHFKFIYNPKKLQSENPNCPLNCAFIHLC